MPTLTQLTNGELYKYLSPLNEDLPYVYDDFQWSHCDEDGYNFGVQANGQVMTEYKMPNKHKTKADSTYN